MKYLRRLLLVFVFIPCALLFSACSFLFPNENVYVTNIVQSSTTEDLTTYTIYYSNGTTSMFTVSNGKDGNDGDDLTLESIKQYCETNNVDFEIFLKEYLSIEQETSIKEGTNKALQSAVSVWCEFPTSYYQTKTEVFCGAGVVYKMNDEYSYIVTNYHVVYYKNSKTSNKIANKIHIFQYGTSESVFKTEDQSGNITVNYGDGAIEATYVGGAMNYDIAVLKVATADLKTYNEHVKPVTIAKNYSIADTAIAIGNPESDGISVTQGIISVESEQIEMTGADESTACEFRVMRIDTAVNGGNSGGGLFNVKGELIGIVNAKVVDEDIDNIAYALPYDNITKVADNLIYYYEQSEQPSQVKKLVLGIEYTVENSRAVYNPTTNQTTLKDDLVVKKVNQTTNNSNISAAYACEIMAEDIIKSIIINNIEYTLTRAHQLPDLLLSIRAGDKVLFKIKRGDQIITKGFGTDDGVPEIYFETIA